MYTLDEIKAELDARILNPSFYDLNDLIDWYSEIELDNVENHAAFDNDNYCRVPLIACKEYDLLLCCWKPGQKSPFHGHPEQGCLVKILSGSLIEELKYSDGRSETRENLTNDVGYITDAIGFHQVSNYGKENAVSLHLYAPGGYEPDPGLISALLNESNSIHN